MANLDHNPAIAVDTHAHGHDHHDDHDHEEGTFLTKF